FAGNRSVGRLSMPMVARAISRHCLDARLAARAVAKGAAVQCGERLTPQHEEGWIHASGRVRMREGKWLGLKAHYQGLELRAGLEMHLGRGGYVGLTAIEEGRVNVCALLPMGSGGPKAELLPRRLREIGLDAVAERLEQAAVDEASITGISHFELGFQSVFQHSDTLALGDGHSLIPPFTGAGMSMAFESAARALPSLLDWVNDRISWSEAVSTVQSRLRIHFRRRMGWANLVHRALLSRVGPGLLRAGVGWRMLPFDSLVRVLREP
ncbi:MAG: hypothetical protein WCN98_17615, partial [Verrucomicrobiaceae bacterium]